MNKVLQIKEQILSYVKRVGPSLPVKVKQNIGTNTLFVSALLAELVSGKQLKLTKAKVGGSPLYYAPGQEEKLAPMLRDHLKEYPKKAFDLLQEYKVLREADQEPAIRVALKEIPDFSKQISLQIGGNLETFWRWYLVKDDQAKQIIEPILERVYAKKEEPVQEELKPDVVKKELEEVKIVETVKEEPKVEQKPLQEVKEPSKQQELLKPEPKIESKPEVESKPEIAKKEVEKPKRELVKEELVKKEPQKIDDDFAKQVIAYLNKSSINILDINVIRKNREINFVVKIPSDIGSLIYMVKAKNKKKHNEGELLLAFTEAQNEKLPLIFLSTGETTKKAEEYMAKNMKGMIFKQI